MSTPFKRVAFKPLALAIALALPALSATTAQADSWLDRCGASYYGQATDTYCHQSYSEGLAAVLTGSRNDEAGVWGYIDKQGRMAIMPAYSDAKPFQNGLAAASQGGLWGYIDTQGKWVIAPRFTEATGFNAEGTALAEEDDHDVLIDRQGKVIKTFELGTRTWGFMPGQKLASMEVPTPPRLINTATGSAANLPAGVMAVGAPTGRFLPAQMRGSRYGGWWGLMDADGHWAVAPDVLRSLEAPLRDGDVIAVRRNDGWAFVNPQGKDLSEERHENVQQAAPGLWLVSRGSGQHTLLDRSLKPVHVFATPYARVQERDGWRYVTGHSKTLLISPSGKQEWLTLRGGRIEIEQGRAWVYGAPAAQPGDDARATPADDTEAPVEAEASDGNVDMAADAAADVATDIAATTVSNVPTPAPAGDAQAQDMASDASAPIDGTSADTAVADGATAAAAEAATADATAQPAADAEVADAAYLTTDAPQDMTDAGDANTLVQVFDRDGRALLDADTLARLRSYTLNTFSPSRRADENAEVPGLPLALLRPEDYSQPLAILTADGKIVSNPEWANIDTYRATMPLVVNTPKGKVGAIDATGAWVVPPEYDRMRAFSGAYTWARTRDMLQGESLLIDTNGKPVHIPDNVNAGGADPDGDLLFYQSPNENRERRWGLWNVRRAAPVLKPEFDRIEPFEDDWTRVQHNGRWGVVNREGKWIVPATRDSSYELEYLGNGFMLVPDPDSKGAAGGYGSTPYKLLNLRTGKSSDTIFGKPDKLAGGRYLGTLADGGAMLFDAQGKGTRVSQGRPESKEQYGDWLIIRQDEREGAIDARGNLKVAALYGEFNPFFVQPEGLARANAGPGYRVIDQTGKTVLEKFGDGFPLASMQRVLFSDDSDKGALLTDLQGREIARLPGRYPVEHRYASEGVVPYSANYGKYGFLDASGKRVVGAHFSELGPMRNGLARARRVDRTGKLYGYIDLTGRYAIAPAYTWAQDFQDGRAMVMHDALVTFIDTRGKATATFGELCDQVVIFDAEEKQSWPRDALTCADATRIDPPVSDTAKAE